jgi:hypothetical protein
MIFALALPVVEADPLPAIAGVTAAAPKTSASAALPIRLLIAYPSIG